MGWTGPGDPSAATDVASFNKPRSNSFSTLESATLAHVESSFSNDARELLNSGWISSVLSLSSSDIFPVAPTIAFLHTA